MVEVVVRVKRPWIPGVDAGCGGGARVLRGAEAEFGAGGLVVEAPPDGG